MEQKILGVRAGRRSLPLHAVALVAAAKSLGRRMTGSDKKRVAREISTLSSAALMDTEIEVAPFAVLRAGELTRDAMGRAKRYAAARDAYIEVAACVQG